MRGYAGFWAAAQEAGRSRIYGGIHYEFDNQEGLRTGRELADYIARRYLLPVRSNDLTSRDAADLDAASSHFYQSCRPAARPTASGDVRPLIPPGALGRKDKQELTKITCDRERFMIEKLYLPATLVLQGETLLSEQDLYLFNEGSHSRLYRKLGAHPCSRHGSPRHSLRRVGAGGGAGFRHGRLQRLDQGQTSPASAWLLRHLERILSRHSHRRRLQVSHCLARAGLPGR